MRKIILLPMILFCINSYSQTKQDKIKELISLNGAFPLSKEVEKNIIADYKKKYNHVPENAWKNIEKKVNINDLLNKVINIYDSRFSEKEIEELLAFYKTEVGKKLIQNSLDMITEIQNESKNWGMSVMQTVNADLESSGYLQSPPPPMPSSDK